jgi:hypothetical protein
LNEFQLVQIFIDLRMAALRSLSALGFSLFELAGQLHTVTETLFSWASHARSTVSYGCHPNGNFNLAQALKTENALDL